MAVLPVLGIVAGCSGPVMISPAMYNDPTRAVPATSALPAEETGSGVRPLIDDDDTESSVQRVVELAGEQPAGQTAEQAEPGVHWNNAGDMTLNVVDADLVEVVRLVLEDGIDANYIIDPTVSGRVTVRTNHAVPAEDIIVMLESVLNLNGAALIREGDLYKIIPREKGDATGLVVPGEAGSGIQVTPVRYADAAQLGELLQPFVVEGKGSVHSDSSRNILMLKGTSSELAVMNELIDTFDVDWMTDKSVGLFPLKHALPSELADELDQLLSDPDTGRSSGKIRFLPIDRLKSLVVIANQPGPLQRAETWINRLDKSGDGSGDGEQIFVYEVQNGRASELAVVLGELFDIENTTVGEAASPLAPGFEDVELVSSSEGGEDADAGGRRRGGSSSPLGRDPFASAFGQRGFSDEGSKKPGAKIVADETTNALLIRATEKEYRKIAEALRKLDILPLQVLVEATIAEVTLKDELSYGVQWFFGSSPDNGVTLSEFTDGVVGQVFPGFSGVLSSGDARVVLNALDDVSDVKILSSPQVMVLDNQAAYFKVGDEVPIVTKQAQGLDFSDSRVVNTVEQRQTGVILRVTPRVNASGLVILDIEQEVSNVVRTTTSGIDSPTIAQRSVGTSVSVESDQTIVLGGLIQDNTTEREAGVPVLSKIPLIGSLFGFSQTISNRTELLVMIKPKVIASQNDAIAATEDVRKRFRSLEPLKAGVL